MIGNTKNPAYKCWENMVARCSNPKASKYDNYGGRGIVVCREFRDFQTFIKHIGPRPSNRHSIDRIDSNGNYEPGNVRWATYTQQNLNKKTVSGKPMKLTLEKHRNRWRFTANGKRYSFATEEQAIQAKAEIYKMAWNSNDW